VRNELIKPIFYTFWSHLSYMDENPLLLKINKKKNPATMKCAIK